MRLGSDENDDSNKPSWRPLDVGSETAGYHHGARRSAWPRAGGRGAFRYRESLFRTPPQLGQPTTLPSCQPSAWIQLDNFVNFKVKRPESGALPVASDGAQF